MVNDHSDSERKETRCRHMGYSFRLTARVLWYTRSHRQDSTYHGICYTSRGTLAGTRNSIIGSTPWRIDPTTHRTMSESSYHGATSRSLKGHNEPFPNIPGLTGVSGCNLFSILSQFVTQISEIATRHWHVEQHWLLNRICTQLQ